MAKTFSVKNWDKFQHYKHRNAAWVKLHRSLLTNVDFFRLSDVAKAHLMLIWVLNGRDQGNCLPYDPRYIAQQIGATERVDLDALVRAGFLVADQALQQLASNLGDSCTETASTQRTELQSTEYRVTELQRTEVASQLVHRRNDDWPDNYFEVFWHHWPNKVQRAVALKALKRIYQADNIEFGTILVGIERYKAGKPPDRDWMHASTFLNQERWNDEPSPIVRSNGHARRYGIASAAQKLREQFAEADVQPGERRGATDLLDVSSDEPREP